MNPESVETAVPELIGYEPGPEVVVAIPSPPVVHHGDHPITDDVEQAMLEATRNAAYNIKRSLLDFVELQERNYEMRRQLTPELRGFLEMFRKRVHNDVSQIEYVFQAVIGMARRGGEIPRFGRSRDQISQSEARKQQEQKRAS